MAAPVEPAPSYWRYIWTPVGLLLAGLATMWGIEIVDTVALPAELPSGEYVLGWRWDCEESNQIWTSCSDVTIVGKDAAA